jgi:hypothetical protein
MVFDKLPELIFDRTDGIVLHGMEKILVHREVYKDSLQSMEKVFRVLTMANNSEWLVKDTSGNLDIRYILYDREISSERYEELLVWAAQDLQLKAVRLILIVAKRAEKDLDIDRRVHSVNIRLFINETTTVTGEIPALFACVTNICKEHDRDKLSSLFDCLLQAKGNPYQTVCIRDGDDFEVRTCVRQYLENILEESIAANYPEIQSEARAMLQAIDGADKKIFQSNLDRYGLDDIYSTRNEIIFAEEVKQATAQEARVKPIPEKKRRESVFGKVKRKVWDGLSRKSRRP